TESTRGVEREKVRQCGGHTGVCRHGQVLSVQGEICYGERCACCSRLAAVRCACADLIGNRSRICSRQYRNRECCALSVGDCHSSRTRSSYTASCWCCRAAEVHGSTETILPGNGPRVTHTAGSSRCDRLLGGADGNGVVLQCQ